MTQRILLTAVTILLLAGTVTLAEEVQSVDEMIEHLAEVCEPEITSYCSQVTPGEGRLLACFYAHQDKISGRCEYALYEAAAKLQDFAAAVTYLATECHDDLIEFCADVEMGEGRVGLCLLEHKEDVSPACSAAMDDGGLVAMDD